MKLKLVLLLCLVGMSMSDLSPFSNCFSPTHSIDQSQSTRPYDTVFGHFQQKSGHAKVRPGAHMFWWLYHSKAVATTTHKIPLAIWLSGGPGDASSGHGNFAGIGPLDIDLKDREHTWLKHMHVLFVDSPVGAGFSYVDKEGDLAESDSQMATDLVDMLRIFLNMHENETFKSTPLHIFGEGYGGKIAVEFAYELHKAIESGKIKCELKSVTPIGGWISPGHSVASWAEFLQQAGYVSPQGGKEIASHATKIKAVLDAANYSQATTMWNSMIATIGNKTNGIDWCYVYRSIDLNKINAKSIKINAEFYLHTNSDYGHLEKIMREHVRQALNLPAEQNKEWGYWKNAVFVAAKNAFMKPAIKNVEKLLRKSSIQVNVVTGHLDLTAATPGTVNWVDELSWTGKRVGTTRHIIVNKKIQGYYKTQDQLTLYSVWRSGRAVPLQNPATMEWILQRIIITNKRT